jgi:hypothetical protein
LLFGPANDPVTDNCSSEQKKSARLVAAQSSERPIEDNEVTVGNHGRLSCFKAVAEELHV